MSQEYAQHVLKVAVAQICRTIGWHSTHASTMDLLIDVTQHFLREISRIMHRYCELYNRTEANLDDLALAYKEIGINLDELMEYVQFVDPIPLTLEVPRFPLPKESNLNFLKPGSREVLTRPVHIPEYMPPLMLEAEGEEGAADRADGDSEKRIAYGDAKSLLNNAAIAIAATVAATMSSEARALTDGGDDAGTSGDAKDGPVVTGVEEVTSTGEGVEDGSSLPHVVINEEVEIPMQTIEVKEPPAVDGDEESANVSKRPESVGVKDKPTQPDDTPVPAVGPKPANTAEEGRPTREISSVIMTTSGFISPAREGKLPESRIPIIPEERPIQQPSPVIPTVPTALTTASHLPLGTALPPGTSVPAGVPPLAGPGPVSSAALLAAAAGSYFPKPGPTDGVAGGVVGLPASVGVPGSVAVGSGLASDASAPLVPPMKPPGGEKPPKKVKKKPADRDKKKANTSKKTDKQNPAGEKGMTSMAKPSLPSDAPFGTVIGKERTDFTTPLPPPPPAPDALAAGRVPDSLVGLNNPFAKNGALGSDASEAGKAMDSSVPPGSFGLVVPPSLTTGKPAKPPKVKTPKEKAVKKRKSAAPKPGPLPVPGEMLMDDPTLLNRPPLTMQNFLPFPTTPKAKKTPKGSKKAAAQRGQFDAELPPPLIPGPLGLGSPSFGGPLKPGICNPSPDSLYGMPPNSIGSIGSSTTAALSLPLKKPPLMGQFKKEEAHEPQPQFIDQAAQLNMLQKMHPSLEITASPSFASHDDHEKPLTPGRMIFEGSRGMKPDTTTSDRDVIVIDDDKSPPHVSAVSSTMSTPPTTKKQRKQAAHSNTNTPSVMGLHGLPSPYAIGPDGEIRLDDPSHFSPTSSSNVPKTPEIGLQHSSSSSWMNVESPRLAGTPKKTTVTGNLFSELASKTPDEAARLTLAGVAAAASAAFEGGKKPKRPKQKPKADAKAAAKLAEANKKLDEAVAAGQKFGNIPGGGHQNPFSLYPGSLNPFAPDASVYSKYLNQSLQTVAGLRNPMPFGMFPLPSGPGLIPDNPLFPRLPPTYPGQPRGPGGFQLPPNPFGLPGINRMNLLRMPTLANRMPGGNQRDFLDEPLDPETKLAQTPLDLQKSTCNVAPLVPPSLFQSATEGMALGGTNELLNLSVSKSTTSVSPSKDTVTTTQTASSSKKESAVATTSVAAGGVGVGVGGGSIFSTTSVSSTVKESYKEDQVVILPAASVLPGASPPQRSSMLVVDVEDSDDGSQSTVGGKSKDGKRKQKEHKKDRKLKDGKIKKKKDKKDKSKSKDREREQQLKELTAGTATSPGVMTMGMIGAEEALIAQLRKERKEKKEKRKDKVKKEKRKDKERGVGAIGVGAGGVGPASSSSVGSTGAVQPSGDIVPKLMLKIGGSNATQSPRSETPDQQLFGASGAATAAAAASASVSDSKRDVSPELARISALVTRPPKLKAVGGGSSAGGSKSKKDEAGKNVPPMGSPLVGHAGTDPSKPQLGVDSDDTFGALKQSAKALHHAAGAVSSSTSALLVNYATTDDSGAGSSTSRGSKVARLADNSAADSTVKPLAGGEPSKKAMKESSKGSKSVHHHHHHHASQVDTYTTTPAHMTDVDGNTVWICPACGRVDDGTPMIGCDGCDAWYHWVCVGIQVPPDDNEDWYCRVCIAKKQDSQADEKQRKRKKKDKKTAKD